MKEVVGIRFKKAGKMYYFDPAGLKLEREDGAIVETARGGHRCRGAAQACLR